MAIFVIKNWCSYSNWFQYPPLGCMTLVLLNPLVAIELISRRSVVLFTWVIISKLVNTIWSILTTIVITTGSAKLQLKFLTTKIPLDLLPNYATNPISIPLLTTSMLGTTIISTPMVVIPTPSDWVTPTLACCFWVATMLFLTLLVELCWHKIDDVLVYGYPLVSTMVQYVDVNTLLVFCSWSK